MQFLDITHNQGNSASNCNQPKREETQVQFSQAGKGFLAGLDLRIKAATDSAYRGCGGSDVLWAERMQDSLQAILNVAPQDVKEEAQKALCAYGYDPNFKPYEADEGECSLTGIEEHCCPCGRHE